MRSDIQFPVIIADTEGTEEGIAWEGGDFIFGCSGAFGGSGGTLTLEYSRRAAAGFAPFIADPVGYTDFEATAPGVIAGWLPKGYVRVQFADAEAMVTSVASYMRPGNDVAKVERATT
jgi:hypothetical protein